MKGNFFIWGWILKVRYFKYEEFLFKVHARFVSFKNFDGYEKWVKLTITNEINQG